MQRVHMLTCFVSPLTTTLRRWIFGSNRRLVRRFEKLTLCPKVVALPQTSHFPATVADPPIPLTCAILQWPYRRTGEHREPSDRVTVPNRLSILP